MIVSWIKKSFKSFQQRERARPSVELFTVNTVLQLNKHTMTTTNQNEKEKPFRLVLLGGGHTNTQVIKHIRPGDERIPESIRNNMELILVSDYDTSLYSGMCPGGVANLYTEPQFSVELCQFSKQFCCFFFVLINILLCTFLHANNVACRHVVKCWVGNL